MSLLEVKNLVVEFPGRRGTLRALDDISFSIAPGEILGVVGESGAGKSLTGAAIIGLLEPPGRVASGQILLEGQRIDNLGHEEMRHIRGRRIGAIFQDPLTSLNPLYTIGRQLTETIQTHLPVSQEEARQRAIRLATRMRVYRVQVLSVLLYGCEGWALTPAQLRELEVFHRRCLRDDVPVRPRRPGARLRRGRSGPRRDTAWAAAGWSR
mgnify:CR=1 FL=1